MNVIWLAACVTVWIVAPPPMQDRGTGAAEEQGASAQPRLVTRIDALEDVLPEEVVRELESLDEAPIDRLTHGEPIYVLVNPVLGDADAALVARALHPDPELTEVGYDGIPRLAAPRRDATLAHDLLESVVKEFFEVFFPDQVRSGNSLSELIAESGKQKDKMILATVDATCQGISPYGIEVTLWLRLYRLEYENKDELPVVSLETLFTDRASGSAEGQLVGELLHDGFRAAAIDALRNRIALHLWGAARTSAVTWRENEAGWLDEHEGKDMIGPTLNAPLR